MPPHKGVPDFKLPPWAFRLAAPLKSNNNRQFGYIELYINEFNSACGIKFIFFGSENPIIAWEEKLIVANGQKEINYVANKEKIGWAKKRVVRLDPDMKFTNGPRKNLLFATLIFNLTTGENLTFTRLCSIETHNF